MNNREDNKIQNENDFEIIDIPEESNDSITQQNTIESSFGMNQQNINGENNISQPSYTEIPNVDVFGQPQMQSNNSISNNEIPQSTNATVSNVEMPNVDTLGQSQMQSNSSISNNEMIPPTNTAFNNAEMPSMDNSISNNEMTNMQNEPDSISTFNNSPNPQVQSAPIDNTEDFQKNVYIPKKDVSSSEPEHSQMDKGTKDIIKLGILVAIVIILLPTLYNLTSGKYHVMNKIKKLWDKPVKTEEKVEEEETEEVEVPEVETEEPQLTFDFSKYNNQVVNNDGLKELLNTYQDNIVSLTSTVENGKSIYKIEIAKDVTLIENPLSDPASAITTFNDQYLNLQSNYLVTVVENDNLISVSAVKQ